METKDDGAVGAVGDGETMLDARREGEHGATNPSVHGQPGNVVRRKQSLPILGDDAPARQGETPDVAVAMRTRIAKSFTFDAAHRLDRLPATHKCHRLHGHTYRVEVTFVGTPNEMGMVVDYDVLDAMWAPLHAQIDHQLLNDVAGLEVPTTENVAAWIYRRFCVFALPEGAAVESVRVYESSTTWAEVPI